MHTETLRTLFLAEIADIRRVAHYNKPELDVEEITKRDVRLVYVSQHFNRYMEVMKIVDARGLEIAEDYFFASFILTQEEEPNHFALGYMLALRAKGLNFSGCPEIPDVDKYLQKLEVVFNAKMTE